MINYSVSVVCLHGLKPIYTEEKHSISPDNVINCEHLFNKLYKDSPQLSKPLVINNVLKEILESRNIINLYSYLDITCRESVVYYINQWNHMNKILCDAGYFPFIHVICKGSGDRQTAQMLTKDDNVSILKLFTTLLASILLTDEIYLSINDKGYIELFYRQTNMSSTICLSGVLLLIRILYKLLPLQPHGGFLLNTVSLFEFICRNLSSIEITDRYVLILNAIFLRHTFTASGLNFAGFPNGPVNFVRSKLFPIEDWEQAVSMLLDYGLDEELRTLATIFSIPNLTAVLTKRGDV